MEIYGFILWLCIVNGIQQLEAAQFGSNFARKSIGIKGSETVQLFQGLSNDAFKASSVWSKDGEKFSAYKARNLKVLNLNLWKLKKPWCTAGLFGQRREEWLEVDMGKMFYVENMFTMGSGNGNFEDYVPYIYIEYKRNIREPFIPYGFNNTRYQMLKGNTDSLNIQLIPLMYPIVCRVLRIYLVSPNVTRRGCMRVSLYGHQFQDKAVSYSIPQGHVMNDLIDSRRKYDFRDLTYDASQYFEDPVNPATNLNGGLGQLMDDNVHTDDLVEDVKNGVYGYHFVGWNKDKLNSKFVEIVIKLIEVRQIKSIHLHTLQITGAGISHFEMATVQLSVAGVTYNHYSPHQKYQQYSNLIKGVSKWVNLTISTDTSPKILPARYIKLQLHFKMRWIVLSEIIVHSEPIRGYYPPEPIKTTTKFAPDNAKDEAVTKNPYPFIPNSSTSRSSVSQSSRSIKPPKDSTTKLSPSESSPAEFFKTYIKQSLIFVSIFLAIVLCIGLITLFVWVIVKKRRKYKHKNRNPEKSRSEEKWNREFNDINKNNFGKIFPQNGMIAPYNIPFYNSNQQELLMGMSRHGTPMHVGMMGADDANGSIIHESHYGTQSSSERSSTYYRNSDLTIQNPLLTSSGISTGITEYDLTPTFKTPNHIFVPPINPDVSRHQQHQFQHLHHHQISPVTGVGSLDKLIHTPQKRSSKLSNSFHMTSPFVTPTHPSSYTKNGIDVASMGGSSNTEYASTSLYHLSSQPLLHTPPQQIYTHHNFNHNSPLNNANSNSSNVIQLPSSHPQMLQLLSNPNNTSANPSQVHPYYTHQLPNQFGLNPQYVASVNGNNVNNYPNNSSNNNLPMTTSQIYSDHLTINNDNRCIEGLFGCITMLKTTNTQPTQYTKSKSTNNVSLARLLADLDEISCDQVHPINVLGQGHSGSVGYVNIQNQTTNGNNNDKDKPDPRFIVKMLHLPLTKDLRRELIQEMFPISQVTHPCFLKLVAYFLTDSPSMTTSEFNDRNYQNGGQSDDSPSLDCLTRGSLGLLFPLDDGYTNLFLLLSESSRVISQNGEIPSSILLNISLQISSGMEHLEKLGIVHRDLAVRNCLIRHLSSTNDSDWFSSYQLTTNQIRTSILSIKITDYAMVIDQFQQQYTECNSWQQTTTNNHHHANYKDEIFYNNNNGMNSGLTLHRYRLPLQWMSPETTINGIFTNKSDIWSYGVTLWEIINHCQYPPYGQLQIKFDQLLLNSQRLFGASPNAVLPNSTKFIEIINNPNNNNQCHNPQQPDLLISCGNNKDLSNLILMCWDLNVIQRPNFVTINRYLENLYHKSIDETRHVIDEAEIGSSN